jgi:hypothetical protein
MSNPTCEQQQPRDREELRHIARVDRIARLEECVTRYTTIGRADLASIFAELLADDRTSEAAYQRAR